MRKLLCLLFAVAITTPLGAQKVVIKGATPAEVVRAVNNELGSQGFRLEDTTTSAARFSLDRGLRSQNTRNGVQSVPVVLELHLRFKQKDDGLEVVAYEEVVGARGQGNLEFRSPVRSRPERDGMQQLLDLVKKDLEARPAP